MRMDNFQIAVSVPVELSAEQHEGVVAAVHHCLIHNTLLHPPTIGLTVQGQVGEMAAVLK
jgi:hypothetical protein